MSSILSSFSKNSAKVAKTETIKIITELVLRKKKEITKKALTKKASVPSKDFPLQKRITPMDLPTMAAAAAAISMTDILAAAACGVKQTVTNKADAKTYTEPLGTKFSLDTSLFRNVLINILRNKLPIAAVLRKAAYSNAKLKIKREEYTIILRFLCPIIISIGIHKELKWMALRYNSVLRDFEIKVNISTLSIFRHKPIQQNCLLLV